MDSKSQHSLTPSIDSQLYTSIVSACAGPAGPLRVGICIPGALVKGMTLISPSLVRHHGLNVVVHPHHDQVFVRSGYSRRLSARSERSVCVNVSKYFSIVGERFLIK